jgi:hypothetical protein
MGKIGAFINDPEHGEYCHVTLDSGETLFVSHEQHGPGFGFGRIGIGVSESWGPDADRIFACDLETREGRATLVQMARDAGLDITDGSPLRTLVHYIKDCRSVAEVSAKSAALSRRNDAPGSA